MPGGPRVNERARQAPGGIAESGPTTVQNIDDPATRRADGRCALLGRHGKIVNGRQGEEMVAALKTIAQTLVDLVYAAVPRPRPHRELLASAKIVAHRGNAGLPGLKENTLEAFDAALAHGAWGLEFDLRWTADNAPVVSHDKTLERVFGSDLDVEAVRLDDLRARAPQVPTLEAVVRAYRGRAHLMIEIKERDGGFTPAHVDSLRLRLEGLAPERDYHLIALRADALAPFDFVPKEAKIGVAEFNTERMSQTVAREGWGGLAGHYVLVNAPIRKRHEARGQAIGTGFIRSKFALYRELNRGVEWVFTNHAARLARILEAALRKS